MYAGAGVVVSRYFGTKETDKVQVAIRTNVAVTLLSDIILILYYVRVEWLHGFEENKPVHHQHVAHGVK